MQSKMRKRHNSNMQDGLLPLFPLQVVLLPGSQLPLHIFEDRYKEMIGEVLRDKLEFGVVLASEKGIVNTGCTATIDRVLKRISRRTAGYSDSRPSAIRGSAAERGAVFLAWRGRVL